MSVLLLRLAGPMQSWGDDSRFTRRDTRSEPTKSGVLGLLAAAQGRRRTDPIEDLARLSFGLRVDQPGTVIKDFQTAIREKVGTKPESMPLSERYYLADAVFVAGISGDSSLIEALREAVTNPFFPLYLGRRSCPVSGQLSLGVVESSLDEALRTVAWQAAPWFRRKSGTKVRLRLAIDSDGSEGELIRDVPISYSPVRREYGWRNVMEPDPVWVDNPDGSDRSLWFSTVAGVC